MDIAVRKKEFQLIIFAWITLLADKNENLEFISHPSNAIYDTCTKIFR